VRPRGGDPRRARGSSPSARATTVLAVSALLASGCGGGARQDAHEAKGSFPVKVDLAIFPVRQAVARPTSLILRVRNTGSATVPNLAVTLDSLNYAEDFAELAAAQRPIWAIERGPGTIPKRPAQSAAVSPSGGGQTNYVNTWAFGPLAPGQAKTFRWAVVPLKPGLHLVHYRIAAGLSGNATAVSASGGPVQGTFIVHIAGAPPPTQVNPNTGKVVPGTYPPTP